MMIGKKKMRQNLKEKKLLVSIKVVGSTGPIRFVVREDETVTNVIEYTLRCYARQGRLPLFSSRCPSSFLLYSPAHEHNTHTLTALNPSAKIGSTGSTNFTMCENPKAENLDVCNDTLQNTCRKWRVWLNNSLGLKFPSISQVSGISIRGFCVPVSSSIT